MAGMVLRVVPKRTLDFTNVSSGSGQSQEIVLVQGIDVSDWREVSMMVRMHPPELDRVYRRQDRDLCLPVGQNQRGSRHPLYQLEYNRCSYDQQHSCGTPV